MRPQQVTVCVMGEIAGQVLAQSLDARLMGVTSRGLFLRLAVDWVVFVSYESHPGPLTLNLMDGDARILGGIDPASTATLLPGRIVFPATGLSISVQDARPWQAPPPPAVTLSPGQRKARMDEIARQLLARPRTSLVSASLPALLGLGGAPAISEDGIALWVAGLREALGAGCVPAIAERIDALLGLGGGLTPSGDDLIAGLLLAFNRWGSLCAPRFPVEELNQAVLPRAYRKTTLLSANLIECAARGQADARLLLALDGIVAGSADTAACVEALAGWGNTSGMDALAGMALALADPMP